MQERHERIIRRGPDGMGRRRGSGNRPALPGLGQTLYIGTVTNAFERDRLGSTLILAGTVAGVTVRVRRIRY